MRCLARTLVSFDPPVTPPGVRAKQLRATRPVFVGAWRHGATGSASPALTAQKHFYGCQ